MTKPLTGLKCDPIFLDIDMCLEGLSETFPPKSVEENRTTEALRVSKVVYAFEDKKKHGYQVGVAVKQ